MKKNNNRRSEENKNPFVDYANLTGKYIKQKYPFLILFFVGFIALSLLNFLNVSTTNSVANFALEEFEIGQIADRTIIADRTLPADGIEPIRVEKGEKIIKKGFAITEDGYAKLKKMSISPVYIDYRAYANSELYFFFISILWYIVLAILNARKNTLKLKEPLMEVLLLILIYSATAFGSKIQVFSSSYSICVLIPGALCAMLVTILFGFKSALSFSAMMSLIVLGASGWNVIPFIFTFATGLSSSAIVRKIERRLDLVLASIIISICEIVFMIVLFVAFNYNFSNRGLIFLGVITNGFLSGILTLGLLTPLEFILNTASVFRLMDLSDLNNSLMRKMCITASGTYHHSLMVAQLAEAGCRAVGANPLLARVGSYYHDIGKMDQSEYFTENQQGENKHDDINPSLSASVIKSHVKKGVEKAHQLHLPQVVIDIIAEHHGNSVISYFYTKAKEKDDSVTPEEYSYPGNPPSTKESAIVMLADTVEAACKAMYRNVENPSASSIEKSINSLVDQKIQHNQLDNCDLTFRDVTSIKEAFLPILAGAYHSRVKYQGQDEKSEEKEEVKKEDSVSVEKQDKKKKKAKKEENGK